MNDDFLYFDYYLCHIHTEKVRIISRVCRDKILTAFSDIENDVEKEMERLANEYPFDPDYHDPENVMEWAYEKGIDYGIDLSETKCLFIAFSAIALYHDWEKSIISFLKREISRNNSVPKISKWVHILKWLNKYDTPIELYDFYHDLNELRLVSNAIKHGEGPSFDELKKINTAILSPKQNGIYSSSSGEHSLLGVDLYIEQSDFERYEAALLKFWDHEFWVSIGERRFRKEKD